MDTEQTTPNWRFWLFWIGITLVGWVIGGAFIFMLGMGMGVSGEIGPLIMVFVGLPLAGNILSGFGQSLALRQYLPQHWWWGIACLIGWIIGGGLALFYFLDAPELMFISIFWGLSTTLTGVIQWMILRKNFSRSSWWILGSSLNWLLGVILFYLEKQYYFGGMLMFVGAAVAIPVSGGILVWILQHKDTEVFTSA